MIISFPFSSLKRKKNPSSLTEKLSFTGEGTIFGYLETNLKVKTEDR